MFHTILTLSYTLPGIYLFIRIWQMFIKRQHVWWYILIFTILFSIYPLSNILDDKAPGIAGAAGKISDYLLPFFLYVFLLVMVTDIILIINLLVRIVRLETIRQVVFTYKYLGTILFLSLMIVIAGVINFNTIRITRYRIELPGKTSGIETLRIAFISDFHLDEHVPDRFVRNFAEKIREINPDVLLYGGDIVEGSGEHVPRFEKILGSIETRYGVFGVLGNHDRIRNFRNNFFTRSGIVLLRDSIVIVNNSFVLAGRNDSRTSRAGAAQIVEYAPDLPIIMIDHRPTDFENISRTKTDVVFSGHTHKGQLFPINLYINRIYELSYGHLRKGNTHFIVSSGIRLWGPKVRTTGKSEIVTVDIRFIPLNPL